MKVCCIFCCCCCCCCVHAREQGSGRESRTAVPSCSQKLSQWRREPFPKDGFLLLTHFPCRAASVALKLRPCYRALVSLPGSYLIPRLALSLRLRLSPLPPTSYCSEQTITRLVWVLRPEINQNKHGCSRRGRTGRGHEHRRDPPFALPSASLTRAEVDKCGNISGSALFL